MGELFTRRNLNILFQYYVGRHDVSCLRRQWGPDPHHANLLPPSVHCTWVPGGTGKRTPVLDGGLPPS